MSLGTPSTPRYPSGMFQQKKAFTKDNALSLGAFLRLLVIQAEPYVAMIVSRAANMRMIILIVVKALSLHLLLAPLRVVSVTQGPLSFPKRLKVPEHKPSRPQFNVIQRNRRKTENSWTCEIMKVFYFKVIDWTKRTIWTRGPALEPVQI